MYSVVTASELFNNLYFDLGVGLGVSSGQELHIRRRARRFDKHNTVQFNGGTAFEYGAKVGQRYDDLPMFFVIEFMHSLGNVATAAEHYPFTRNTPRIASIDYNLLFLGPGVVCYMAPNLQLAVSAGFTFGSIQYNYDNDVSIRDNLNASFAMSMSMAFDIDIANHKVQIGIGGLSTDFNQRGSVRHAPSFTGRMFLRYCFYNNDRIRRYYNR